MSRKSPEREGKSNPLGRGSIIWYNMETWSTCMKCWKCDEMSVESLFKTKSDRRWCQKMMHMKSLEWGAKKFGFLPIDNGESNQLQSKRIAVLLILSLGLLGENTLVLSYVPKMNYLKWSSQTKCCHGENIISPVFYLILRACIMKAFTVAKITCFLPLDLMKTNFKCV